MPENPNPAQPADAEGMASTTDQLLRLLSQQPKGSDSDDELLGNPELEQLFGNLSKGLDQGIAEGALGIPTAEPLTLESLVASLEPPPAEVRLPAAPAAQPVVPAIQAVSEAVAACPECGSANPAATRFRGMCGHGLQLQSSKIYGNGAKPALPEPPQLAQISGTTSSSLGFKTALLGGLVLVLAGTVYQKQLWREPVVANVIASVRNGWTSRVPVANPPAEPSPAATKQPESGRSEPIVIRTPATVVRPSKPSPTVVRRGLAEPAPVDSAPLPQEIPLPPLPPAPVAESPASSPVEKPPVTVTPVATAEVPAPKIEPAKTSQVVPGVLIFKVNPQYPSVARAARVQGSVVMHATIGTDGTIQQLRVVSGNPLLLNAAMEAVKKWRYRPYMLDDKPVEGETDITVTFKGE